MDHRIGALAGMPILTIIGLTALYYGLRRPVWVRLDYGRRRYHGVSALVQGVPMYRGVSRGNVVQRPNEAGFLAPRADGDDWTDAELGAMNEAASAETSERVVPVCILGRATIEEINWAQSWRDLDDRLEQTARGIDARLTVAWPEMMGIYRRTARNESFILNKLQHNDFAGLMRADTGALRIMFAEVEAHLADAEQLQAA